MISNTKKRLLLTLELLYRTTDEEHPLSTVKIIDYLNDHNITIDRKTLKGDIELLLDMGYDIVVVKSSPNKYFWGERIFEIPELKMLLDAVSSARFITESKSSQLENKIISLAGVHQREQLKRHIIATGRAKADNESLYYIIDTITEAINQSRKIEFQYIEYNGRKEKVLRHNGETYLLSPYVLYWNEDYYYVIGYSEKRQKITAFRVDRIYEPIVTEQKSVPKSENFSAAGYSHKVFQMFGGKENLVTLECDESLMKYVVDRFGTDIETEVHIDGTFIAKVTVELSPTFYGWVFQFANKVKIIEPAEAVYEFNCMLTKFR